MAVKFFILCCAVVGINTAENSRPTFSGLEVHKCSDMALLQIKVAFLGDQGFKKKKIITRPSLAVV